MHASFTRTLREALSAAQQEARSLKQDFVSTEHLLLGLLQSPTSEALRVLQQNNVQAAAVRTAVARDVAKGKDAPVVTGDLPLSPKAQRVVNLAIVKAQTLRERSISTRVALLALLEEDGTSLRQALARHGADMDELLQALARQPAESEA